MKIFMTSSLSQTRNFKQARRPRFTPILVLLCSFSSTAWSALLCRHNARVLPLDSLAFRLGLLLIFLGHKDLILCRFEIHKHALSFTNMLWVICDVLETIIRIAAFAIRSTMNCWSTGADNRQKIAVTTGELLRKGQLLRLCSH